MLWVGTCVELYPCDAYIIANIANGFARIGVSVHLFGDY